MYVRSSCIVAGAGGPEMTHVAKALIKVAKKIGTYLTIIACSGRGLSAVPVRRGN